MSYLSCALCQFDTNMPDDEDDTETIVVMNGQSVCMYHCGYVQGGDFTRQLILLREQKGR